MLIDNNTTPVQHPEDTRSSQASGTLRDENDDDLPLKRKIYYSSSSDSSLSSSGVVQLHVENRSFGFHNVHIEKKWDDGVGSFHEKNRQLEGQLKLERRKFDDLRREYLIMDQTLQRFQDDYDDLLKTGKTMMKICIS